MTNLVLNQELNGVELYFDSKPMKAILETLKSNGFRWSGFKSCWYAKQNEKTLKLAEQLTGEETLAEAITETTIKKDSKVNLSLWELTRITEFEVNGKQPVKEIAKEVRTFVKKHFPMCKFSVTSTHSSINFYITSSPFEKDSIYLKAIEEYCTSLLKAYNYCTCYDPYGDYGSSYNFYGSYAKIDYNYTQTEQTETIKTDILNFDNKLTEFEKAEEERKELEYQEYQKQQEIRNKEYQEREIEEKKEIEIINNSVNVIELEEVKQYFIIGSQFAHLNKNNTLEQYKEEVKAGEFYLQDVKVTKEIHFTSEEALNYFSNHLLTDFDFLEKTGGSFTDDKRFTSMIDYENMEKEERDTVIFNSLGVAVYLDNKLQFVIDAQGFSYARYVGLIDDNTKIQKDNKVIQFIDNNKIEELKNKAEVLTDISTDVITELSLVNTWDSDKWNEYKEAMKDKFKNNRFRITKEIIQQLEEDQTKLKAAMYKLLKEVDGIQEQFKNADIKQGQKLTIFKMSDWGMISISRIIFDSFEPSSYAQYTDVVKLTFKQEKKRGLFYNHYYKDLLIYNGWLDLPTEVLNIVEQTGNGITKTTGKYMSCDKRQYDLILDHFITAGKKPIVNTYKPIF